MDTTRDELDSTRHCFCQKKGLAVHWQVGEELLPFALGWQRTRVPPKKGYDNIIVAVMVWRMEKEQDCLHGEGDLVPVLVEVDPETES
eukprot:8804090-Ditylum_brightwellii.AAC.1